MPRQWYPTESPGIVSSEPPPYLEDMLFGYNRTVYVHLTPEQRRWAWDALCPMRGNRLDVLRGLGLTPDAGQMSLPKD